MKPINDHKVDRLYDELAIQMPDDPRKLLFSLTDKCRQDMFKLNTMEAGVYIRRKLSGALRTS